MYIIYIHTHTYIHQHTHERTATLCVHTKFHTYIQTYVKAKLYFACASMVAIFYFILLHFQCLHVEELTNLFTHSCTKLLLIQNTSEIAHICVFSHSIKLEMTCASKFQMLHKHTHTHASQFQCVYAMYVFTYMQTCI